jgi:hypothetical protein
MMLTDEERQDRPIVNETVRTGRSPLRRAGSADRYGVPMRRSSWFRIRNVLVIFR